jgi:hypothetical protein
MAKWGDAALNEQLKRAALAPVKVNLSAFQSEGTVAGDPKDWRVNASRAALDELLGQSFTWGPDADGNLHFYVDGKRVGTARKDQLPSLIVEAAGQLRK